MMDDGDDMDVSFHDGAPPKRACDPCRKKKIRCNRDVPCSNCKVGRVTCTTTAPAQKAQRHRVHISEEYENKIDKIEDRLAGIEQVLTDLASRLGNIDLQQAPEKRSTRIQATKGSATDQDERAAYGTANAPFEGETNINRQSEHAREFLAQAVSETLSVRQNDEITSALTALQDLVSHQSHSSPSINTLIDPSLKAVDPRTLDRPPWFEVSNGLADALKCNMTFSAIFPYLKMEALEEIFEDAYHRPGSCSASRRVLAYGIMENIFNEFKLFPLSHQDVSMFFTYSIQCRRHVEVAMSQLDLFMPASYENVMALLLAASQAIVMCKPSLCWIMISTAIGLCQSLGYHRISTMSNDSPEVRNSKIYIFWMIYMFDKTLSLRLGRASMIQDWDISLPFLSTDTQSTNSSNGNQMWVYWVKVARVQGQVYEKLYCPAAFLRSPEERTRSALELVRAMDLAWIERGKAFESLHTNQTEAMGSVPRGTPTTSSTPNETGLPSERPLLDANEYLHGSFGHVQDLFFHSDVVVHYSTCALIQRAMSTDDAIFTKDCLDSSRAAIVAHSRANAQFNKKGNEELWAGYVHWSILQAPFTPFIVVFCNAIQNADSTEFGPLSDFVASLESCRAISTGAERLYRMCLLFLKIARLYIESKTNDTVSQSTAQSTQSDYYKANSSTHVDLNAMTSFDHYLSALGLVPSSTWPLANYPSEHNVFDGQSFPPGQEHAAVLDPDGISFKSGAFDEGPNSVQDWWSGSRYLINLMESGDDLQMLDL